MKNGKSKELICISEDKEATLIWNYDLSTNNSSGNFEGKKSNEESNGKNCLN